VVALCLFLQCLLFGVVCRSEQTLPGVCGCEMWVLSRVSIIPRHESIATSPYTFRDTSKTIGSIFSMSVLRRNCRLIV
jgi:hypothetical protein